MAHETMCKVIAVRRNVRRNEDHLTFRCFADGDKSTEKEAWSSEELETKNYWGFKISQPYLSTRKIKSGGISFGEDGAAEV